MKLIPLLFPWLIEKKTDQANSIAYFFFRILYELIQSDVNASFF